MSNWFSQASKGFRSPARQGPVEFQLRCACGRLLDGERGIRHQVLTCPECAHELFVLPNSVYPPLKSKKAKAKQSTPSAPQEPPQTSGKSAKPTSRKPQPAVASKKATAKPGAAKSSAAKQAEKEQLSIQAAQALAAFKRTFTPFRVILCTIAGILLLTVYGVVRTQAVRQAQRVIQEAPKLGREALASGDFFKAASELTRAGAALDTLGRTDTEAQTLRQLLRESTAAGNLCQHGIFELVNEANQSRRAVGGDWAEAFRLTYRGSWLLFDLTATLPIRDADSAAGEQNRLLREKERPDQIELPLVIQQHRVALASDFQRFDALLEPNQPQRVIFAAQLEDCRLVEGEVPCWEIVLDPKTAFLWSDPTILGTLGLPPDEAAKSVLARQAEHLGVEP